MAAPNGNANYPFASTTPLRDGSFLGAATEDKFMQIVWRIRRWSLYVTSDLIWTPDNTDPGTFYTVLSAASSYTIEPGFSPTSGAAFSSEDDIWCGNFSTTGWRETRQSGTYVDGSLTQGMEIQITGQGSYINADPGISEEGSGTLESELVFYAYDGDENAFLGTNFGTPAMIGTATDTATGLVIQVKVGGVLSSSNSLYRSSANDGTFPNQEWSCAGDIIMEPPATGGFWPWEIDGTNTFDIDDGTQGPDHKRPDTDGRPRAIGATHHL